MSTASFCFFYGPTQWDRCSVASTLSLAPTLPLAPALPLAPTLWCRRRAPTRPALLPKPPLRTAPRRPPLPSLPQPSLCAPPAYAPPPGDDAGHGHAASFCQDFVSPIPGHPRVAYVLVSGRAGGGQGHACRGTHMWHRGRGIPHVASRRGGCIHVWLRGQRGHPCAAKGRGSSRTSKGRGCSRGTGRWL